ncbi:MAG: sulfotransferase [Microcoleaceae cyanobacterium]
MTVFLIGGCPRSGTTLLQNILCSVSSTNPAIGEVGYLYHLAEAYHSSKIDFESQGKYFFKDLAELRQFSITQVSAFLNQIHHQYPTKTHTVLKHPLLSRYFPDLFELIEDVKFLITIRDPRDTIASLIQVGERMQKQSQTRHLTPLFTQRNISEYLNFYLSAYVSAWNHPHPQFKQKICYLKYEYLVENPQAALKNLSQFTGLPLETINLQQDWQRNLVPHAQLKDAAQSFNSLLYNQGISRDRIRHYPQVLTPEEIQFLQTEGKNIFQQFNYPLTD